MGSGMQKNVHVGDVFSAEAIACIQALQFAKDMGFKNIVMEGDSKNDNCEDSKRDNQQI